MSPSLMRVLVTAVVVYSYLTLIPYGALGQIPPSPPCAEDCAIAGIPSSGCTVTDTNLACYCNSTSFIASLVLCILHNCSEADQCVAAGVLKSFCASRGVHLAPVGPLSPPAAGVCPTSTNLSSTPPTTLQTSTPFTTSPPLTTPPPNTVTLLSYTPTLPATKGVGGLTTGGKVGLGVGVGTAVMVFLVVVAVVFYRRGERRGTTVAKPAGKRARRARQVHELPGDQIQELPGVEAAGHQPRWI